jgi:hypothetical protein
VDCDLDGFVRDVEADSKMDQPEKEGSMKLRILATAGDGIGPAVTNQEVGVLKRSGHWFCIRH